MRRELYNYAAVFETHYFCSSDEWCNKQAEEQPKRFKYWNMVLQLVFCASNIGIEYLL